MSFWVVASNLASFFLGLILARGAMHLGVITAARFTLPSNGDRDMRHIAWGVVFLTLGIIVFGIGVRVGYDLVRRDQNCLSEYANDLADALEPRQRAAETRDQRELEVFAATSRLLEQEGDADELRKALNAYLRADRELIEQRAANPYPDPPREVCE